MIPFPSALVAPAIYGAALMALVSSGWAWLKLSHDPAIRQEYADKLTAETAVERDRLQTIALTLVEAANADQLVRERRRVEIRERIIRAPITTACVGSPAVAAALDGLRHRPNSNGATPGPNLPSGVSRGTAATPLNK